MINKINKLINNKFLRFLKFIFFLRYLLAIFFIAIVLFLLIPQFFDYKKKEAIVKFYLSQSYGLEIEKIDNIKFKSLPVPHLSINGVYAKFFSNNLNSKIKQLSIYPEIFSIYNYNNFKVKKIKLEKVDLDLDLVDLKILSKILSYGDKKIFLKNLNLNIKDRNKKIINLNNVFFINYGYKKNIITGDVFNHQFNINFKDDFKNINFKLLDTGISVNLNIYKNNEKSPFKGELKGNILNSNLKLDYSLEDDSINIKNLIFRDKNLAFDTKGSLKFKPFFYTNFSTLIKSINTDLIMNLDIENLLKFKDLIKRLNGQHNITFENKKFYGSIVEKLNIKNDIEYGRLNITKNFEISDSKFQCKGNVNLLDEYPILQFNCLVNSPDRKALFKKIKINSKKKKEPLNLEIKGNLNLLNKKVNFTTIEMNNDYTASKEDLRYFKSSFENILLDNGFLKIFSLSKIKKFIEEIS